MLQSHHSSPSRDVVSSRGVWSPSRDVVSSRDRFHGEMLRSHHSESLTRNIVGTDEESQTRKIVGTGETQYEPLDPWSQSDPWQDFAKDQSKVSPSRSPLVSTTVSDEEPWKQYSPHEFVGRNPREKQHFPQGTALPSDRKRLDEVKSTSRNLYDLEQSTPTPMDFKIPC